MSFFRENLGKLEDENEELVGFEVVFPSLLDRAHGLNIDVPNDSPILKNIFAKRDEKLTRYLN
jgi:ent-copalyl diphosphate synthase